MSPLRNHRTTRFRRPSPRSAARPLAFTLVELTISLAITSILLVAIGGALIATTSAADTGADSLARANGASNILSQINADLSVATAINSTDPTDFTITVPDRNNDGRPETIEYKWARAGEPISRSVNGGAAGSLGGAFQSLTYTLTTRPPAQAVESSEQVLISSTNTTSGSRSKQVADDSNFAAQYVRPTLPAAAVSWKITKVAVFLSQNASNSKRFQICITPASAALKPTGNTLATVPMTSGSLPNAAQFITSAIGPVSGLAPGQGVCIVIKSLDGGSASVWWTTNAAGQPFNAHYMSSSDAGVTWSAPNDADDMLFMLYGTYTTMVEP